MSTIKIVVVVVVRSLSAPPYFINLFFTPGA